MGGFFATVIDGNARTRAILAGSLLLIAVAAVFSTGFHFPDEHAQILEFVSHKKGMLSGDRLPWEFRERIRPWLQPWLYFHLGNGLSAVGMTSPFTQVLVFRLLSGVLTWLALVGLLGYGFRGYPDRETRSVLLLLSCFLYFVPYLAVRPSSENLSASAFAFAFLALYSRPDAGPARARRAMAAGLLCGLAFGFRYQTGLLSAGLLAHAVWSRRLDGRGLALFLSGTGAVLAMEAGIDRWGYGEWVFPSFKYVLGNLLREIPNPETSLWGRLGVSPIADLYPQTIQPWYGYFTLALSHGPIAAILFFSLFIFWFRHPRDAITWSTVPFFLIHCLIGHKEFRFLFPIAPFAPLVLVGAIRPRTAGDASLLARLWRARRSLPARILVAVNVAALVVFSLVPNRPDIRLQKAIYDISAESFESYFIGGSPYVLVGYDMKFYQPRALVLNELPDQRAFVDRLREETGEVYLIDEHFSLSVDPGEAGYQCSVLHRGLPAWSASVNFFGWVERTRSWNLYRCAPGGSRAVASKLQNLF